MKVQVDVQYACDDDTAPEIATVESWIVRAIEACGNTNDAEVSVRIVNGDEMRTLNSEYRGKDRSTNVLSFPAGEVAGLPADAPVLLGDIVICASVVRDEAASQNKATADHWAHMLVHGALHLLGYDHEADTDAAEMEALEARILAWQGLSDPYGASGET